MTFKNFATQRALPVVALMAISLYTTLYHPQLSVKKQTDELGSPRI